VQVGEGVPLDTALLDVADTCLVQRRGDDAFRSEEILLYICIHRISGLTFNSPSNPRLPINRKDFEIDFSCRSPTFN
jgi:hypothetical protein